MMASKQLKLESHFGVATTQEVSLPPPLKLSSTPAALGSTTLLKKALSYRWVIDNANIFMREKKFQLRSPTFFVFIPLRNYPAHAPIPTRSSWTLLIEKIFYDTNDVCISLCSDGDGSTKSKVLISQCTFSFLNPETFLQKYSTTSPTVEGVLQEKFSVGIKIISGEIRKCLFDGTLTIQVNADIVCLTDPIETVDHICEVPLDNIRSEMHRLYKDEVFTDLTIKCGEKEFKVHRAVLASQSPVFKKMFEVDMKEKRSSIIKISDFTPPAMSDFVTYLYTGIASNVSSLAKELLNAADKYELPRLFTLCENELKMKIKVANVVDMLILADLHTAAHLKKACLTFIHLHSAEVHKTSKWKYLKENHDQYAALIFEAVEYTP